MRILDIRFKNINSLAGEWQVDLTQPEYVVNGIFAITGPTGAGKTTLLDVICLALYGRTPRLERVNRSGNDLMTRQTGECFAEVTFSTPAGRFTCHWSQHRARKKSDGDLQTPRHEISDADSGQVIDNQIRTVEKRIEVITGMDFERFTRSMMLAQGGFAAFLKASADERAPILEQITGTGIYSEISVNVHERHAMERQKLQVLQDELNGLRLLTPDQESALINAEAAQSAELSQQQTILNQRRQQHEWRRQCLALEQRIDALTQQHRQWTQHNEAFADSRTRLAQANQALELAGPYSALTALRQSQQQDQQHQSQAVQAEASLLARVTSQRHALQQAEAESQSADGKLLEMRPVFKQVHVLDSNITQQRLQLQRLQADCTRHQSDVEAARQQNNTLQAAASARENALAASMQDHEADYDTLLARLTDDVALKQAQSEQQKAAINALLQGRSLTQWRQQHDELSRRLVLCEALSRLYEERNSRLARQQGWQQQMQDVDKRMNQIAATLQQCAELMSTREQLLVALQKESTLLQTIKDLAARRVQLSDGEPCPLCGALEHPYASQPPDADVEALNSRLQQAGTLLKDSRQQHQQLSDNMVQLQENHRHLSGRNQEEQQSLQLLEQNIAAQHSALNITAHHTVEQCSALASAEQQQITQTLEQIELQQQQLADMDQMLRLANEKLADNRQRVTELAHTRQRLQDSQQQLDQHLQQHAERLAELNQQQQMLGELIARRKQLLADDDPDLLEGRLESAYADTLDAVKSAFMQCQSAEKRLDENRQLQQTLNKQIQQRAEKITASAGDFGELLISKGFSNESVYLAATLTDSERLHLQQQADRLQQQGTELQALLRQSTSELDTLSKQALSTQPLDALQQALDEQDKQVSLLQEALGGLRRDLDNHQLARAQQQQQADKINAHKTVLARWSALHELIGSADGKKFRNFAQGLTFELMVSHANQQLAKMTDRYLLVRDRNQPLDLNVTDFYQAGEVRSTRNLSGGESFIVSLALALGLSRMASRNVRVDSLFLDEGFGTLDEDALDTALETLASLQQEGKLIGVISHVPALKERISTQIKVSPGTGGRSSLSGPGCHAR